MSQYKLMEVFGIELEYMVTDKKTMDVLPVADKLFKKIMNETTNEVTSDRVDWSNELVNHVVEFKNNTPEPQLKDLTRFFQKEVQRANKELESFNAALMPTAMHPWMNPETETKLWPHENNEIYKSYDRIFSCKGHGWSNLQSLHINISFNTDEEFHKLHSAIRFFLPLIPAISSSSPFVEGKHMEYMSQRLFFYLQNQRRIPSIIGQAVPEVVRSYDEYQEIVLKPMYKDIAPHDPQGILQHEWLNSRGAIPKFERGCIEIRLSDVQEAPIVDLSIADFWIKTLKKMMEGSWIDLEKSESFSPKDLRPTLNDTVKKAENSVVDNLDYLSCFGINKKISAKELLQHIHSLHKYESDEVSFQNTIKKLLQSGSLSSRILKNIKTGSKEEIFKVYDQLRYCLQEGRFFEN